MNGKRSDEMMVEQYLRRREAGDGKKRCRLAIALRIIVVLIGTVALPTRSGWALTRPKNISARHEGTVQKNETPIRLPTTYADRKSNKAIFAQWEDYIGRWAAHGDSGEEVIAVAFVPRLPRPGKDVPYGTLVGFIPKGKYEGVLLFQRPTGNGDGNTGGVIEGHLLRADRNLTRLEAKLMTPGRGPDKRRLILHIQEEYGRKEFLLEWAGDIDDTALSGVCIIAHRGLGFAGLDNRPEALRNAWYFGASGIEFDITVPYTYATMSKGIPSAFALTDRLTVYHPPLVNQTANIDRIPQQFFRAKHVFEELEQYGVPFIYVDPKVKWLSPASVKDVLRTIISLANERLERTSSMVITIAAPDGNTAKFLGGEEALRSSPHFTTGHLSWTFEWTESKEPKGILTNTQQAPSVLSFNLIKVGGSSKWPAVKWAFQDIPQTDEKEMNEKSQILIFWTANNNNQFRGSLDAAKHPKRMGRPGKPGEIGIMTDYPHRLAYWLATPHLSAENRVNGPENLMTYSEGRGTGGGMR